MNIPLIRKIQANDNKEVEALIIKVMSEYDCVGDGYSINDPEVSNMFEAYNQEDSQFFVVELENKIIGCAGIAALANGDHGICELRKMYFYPEARGLGLGQKMLDKCLSEAKLLGYSICYLETVDRMNKAKKLYTKNGFLPLESSLGKTGHSGCDSFFKKTL